MKVNKGMILDVNEEAIPPEHYKYAQNIIQLEKHDAPITDEGNQVTYINTVSQQIAGVVDIGNDYVCVFFKNSDIIEILYGGEFHTRLNDIDIVPLGLSNNSSIQGTYKFNNKGEIIIAFIDGITVPKIINIGKYNDFRITEADDDNDIKLFQEALPPTINVSISQNGGLESGKYIIVAKYINSDGSETSNIAFSDEINIGSGENSFYNYYGQEGGSATNSSISIQVNNIDSRFSKIKLSTIKIINGVRSAEQIVELSIPSNNSIQYTYTGLGVYTDSTVLAETVQSINYSIAKAITQHEKKLYLANLESDDNIEWQEFANKIKGTYSIQYIPFADIKNKTGNDLPKSFVPGEVYAFYIRFILSNGTRSKAFFIPGKTNSNTYDISGGLRTLPFNYTVSDLASDGITVTQLENIDNEAYLCNIFDSCTKTSHARGNLGFFISEEQYPSDDFQNYDISLTPLASQHVILHKMPSVGYINKNHRSTLISGAPNENWHNTILQPHITVDFNVEDYTLPSNVVGYEICYAERSYDNATVLGFDLSHPSAKVINETNIAGKYWSTGGFREILSTGHATAGRGGFLDINDEGYDNTRCHNLSLLRDKPFLSNPYIVNEIFYKDDAIYPYDDSGRTTDSTTGLFGGFDQKLLIVVDTKNPYDSSAVQAFKSLPYTDELGRFINVEEYDYLAANTEFVNNRGKSIINYEMEDCLLLVSNGASSVLNNYNPSNFNTADLISYFKSYGSSLDLTLKILPKDDTTPRESPFYYSIRDYKTAPYSSFYNQTLIPCKTVIDVNEKYYGGDAYISSMSYYTHASEWAALGGNKLQGIKTLRECMHFGVDNYNLQYDDDSDTNTRVYPEVAQSALTPLVVESPALYATIYNWLFAIERGNTYPMQYDRSYSAPNSFFPTVISYPDLEFTDKYPNRIIRSTITSEEETDPSWRNILPNDYYEHVKNRGDIVNLESMDDKLLIHCRDSLFVTRDKTKLENEIDIIIGSGDLFEIPPQEIIPTDGYTGLHDKNSALKFIGGYAWINGYNGKVFIFSDKLNEISNKGLRTFFRDNFSEITTEILNNGIGTSLCYDQKYNRLLLSANNGNNHFALSYCVPLDMWVSFHNFSQYTYLYNTPHNFYSFNAGFTSNIFKHNTGYGGKLFNIDYYSYMDIPVNMEPEVSKTLFNINWETILNNPIQGGYSYLNTIDYITVYNRYQCSGKIALSKKNSDDLTVQYNANNMRNIDGTWKFNNFRDIALLDSERIEPIIKDISEGFAVNPNSINESKEWYDKRRFIDKFHIVRFEWKGDKELSLKSVNFNVRKAIR